MTVKTQLNIRSTYSFDVYPSSVLTTEFKNCTLLSVLDPTDAATQLDIMAIHAQVYPYLPKGLPDDPMQFTYYKFRLPSGVNTIIADAWINHTTVKETTSTTISIEVANCVPQDIDKLRRVLESNGYSHISLKIKE